MAKLDGAYVSNQMKIVFSREPMRCALLILIRGDAPPLKTTNVKEI